MTFKLITALVTPLNKNKTINISQMIELIDYQYDSGVENIVLFGTTGEGSLISLKEKIKAFKKIKREFKNINFYIGISHISSFESVNEIKKWNKFDIKGYLVLTPYYISTNNKGLLKYYKNINSASMHDIIIYQVKKRTGQDMTSFLVNDLMTLDKVVGIKYAMSFKEVKMLKEQIHRDDFEIYLGNDDQLIEGMDIKVNGIISVISNIFPGYINDVLDAYKSISKDKALMMFKEIDYFMTLLFKEVNPLGIKYALSLKKAVDEYYLDPLFGLSYDLKIKIKEEYERLSYEIKNCW